MRRKAPNARPRQAARKRNLELSMKRVIAADAHQALISTQDQEDVDRWCTRMRDLLRFREGNHSTQFPTLWPSTEASRALFDQQLLTCIRAKHSAAMFDDLINQQYEIWLVAAIAWFIGIYQRRQSDPSHFEQFRDLVVGQTIAILNPITIAPDVIRAALDDAATMEIVERGDGPVKAAVRAVGMMAKRTPHLVGNTSSGKLTKLLANAKKHDRLLADRLGSVAAITLLGFLAGTPNLLDVTRQSVEV